jgi:hypothetical protein
VKPEEVYQIWAPPDSPWSPWAIPVPFVQMVCVNPEPPNDISVLERLANGFDHAPDLALVVDLPGGEAVRFALSLALRGFRPVPVIDGSPGPNFIAASADLFAETAPLSSLSAPSVDMREILRGLCAGAALLRTVTIPSYASPAFVLDANRMAGYQPIRPEAFDNRWKTFPQDFPSAQFLLEHGVRRVVLVQERAVQPQEDLSHVLLRWQGAGIRLEAYGMSARECLRELKVDRPLHFRALWQRALALLGLRRGTFGGFGDWPHGTGGA